MKQALLFILFSFCIGVLSAQDSVEMTLYPNPTTGTIHLNNAPGVETLEVYNLVGRKVKSFPVVEDKKYDLTTLPPGMYLVRMLNERQRVLVTRRVQKR